MKDKGKINVYHFINYNRNDLPSYLNNLNHDSTVICLDLEDSVQDLFKPENNVRLKQQARNSLLKIFQAQNYAGIKWSIRLNSFHSPEFQMDIKFLAELKSLTKLNSLLLPKTESNDEVENFSTVLQDINIDVEEIIPIIETRKGFEGIESIAGLKDAKLKRIVFGHCDFNYDNNIFPFFHQNSREYWDWIKKLYTTAKSSGKEFINSAYLRLNDNEGFNSMLSKLSMICDGNFGQVALSYKQSELCRNFNAYKKELNGFDKNLKGKDILIYAENIVKNFENNNEQKGFSIAGEIRNLISPHEYLAAKNYLKAADGN